LSLIKGLKLRENEIAGERSIIILHFSVESSACYLITTFYILSLCKILLRKLAPVICEKCIPDIDVFKTVNGKTINKGLLYID